MLSWQKKNIIGVLKVDRQTFARTTKKYIPPVIFEWCSPACKCGQAEY